MRFLSVFAVASLLLVLPVAAPAAAIGFPPLDYLYNWPTECGTENFWFGGVVWEGHCVEGVRFFTPGLAGDGTRPIQMCVTSECELLP